MAATGLAPPVWSGCSISPWQRAGFSLEVQPCSLRIPAYMVYVGCQPPPLGGPSGSTQLPCLRRPPSACSLRLEIAAIMKPTSSVALVSLGSRALAMLRPASDDPVLPAKGHAQLLEPRHFPDLNPIRLRTRYGPFTVPGVEDPDTMGMQSFTGLLDFPCTGCIVTYIAADLEFEDGSLANAHTGMWLHHTLLASVGKQDETCD